MKKYDCTCSPSPGCEDMRCPGCEALAADKTCTWMVSLETFVEASTAEEALRQVLAHVSPASGLAFRATYVPFNDGAEWEDVADDIELDGWTPPAC